MISGERVRDRALQKLVGEAEDAEEDNVDVNGSDYEEEWVNPLAFLVYICGWVSLRRKKEIQGVIVV